MRTYRFASHIHSAWSDDSDWGLERISRVLSRLGFHGALIADHDRTLTEQTRQEMVAQCRTLSGRGFLLVPGVEYQDPDHVVHMPVYGDIPFLGRSPEITDLLRHAEESGGAAVFAHPARRDAYQRFDERWLPHLAGIEVWNRKYDGVAPSAWALETARFHHLPMFVSLDYHGPRQMFPLAMHISVESPATEQSVVSALRDRQAHATCLGMSPEVFASPLMASSVAVLERSRGWLAPRIRRIEGRVGSLTRR